MKRFIKPVLTSRRTFLERSVMGAGGLLLAPLLMESCVTDHNFPGPDTDPPLLEFQVDWNDDAKNLTVSAIEMIPEAGDLLGGLLEIFWPDTKEDVWGEIKEQVEALVDQKIAAAIYTQVAEDLVGLNNSLVLYVNEVKEGTTTEILSQWMITKNLFVEALPHFQSAGNELPLLPLFGQFANLYLGLLRDGVAFGQSWGRTDKDHQQDIADLQNAISDYTTWATNTYNNGRSALQQKTKADSHNIEPFKTVNTYDRQLTQTVLVFMDMWPYFDVTIYPNGTKTVYRREIYSDPMGTADDSGPIVIASPPPTQAPTNISVWAFDRINCVQVTYPAGSGPGGVTQTKRMGDQGGIIDSPTGGSYNLSPSLAIMAGRVTYGSIVNSMQFLFSDNTSTPMMGAHGGVYGGDSGWIGYPDTFLSSVHINGVSTFYASADLVVFGFEYWTTPAAQLNAVQALYVKSPKERTAADFAKQFPTLGITDSLITDELKAARKAYWDKLSAHAATLK